MIKNLLYGIVLGGLLCPIQLLSQYLGGTGRGDFRGGSSHLNLNGSAFSQSFSGGIGQGVSIQTTGERTLNGLTIANLYPGGAGSGHSNAFFQAGLLNGTPYSLPSPGGNGMGNFFVALETSYLNGQNLQIKYSGGAGIGSVQTKTSEIILNGSNFIQTFPGGGGKGEFSLKSAQFFLSGAAYTWNNPGGSGRGDRSMTTSNINLSGAPSIVGLGRDNNDFFQFELQSEDGKLELTWPGIPPSSPLDFFIEHSQNGVDFNQIETGNTLDPQKFPVLNLTNFEERDGFYRVGLIRPTDSPLYSSSKQFISVGNDLNFIRVFPNPAKNKLQVEMQENNESGEFTIFDSRGKLVQFNSGNWSRIFSVDTSPFPSGVYFLKIKVGKTTKMARFIKE